MTTNDLLKLLGFSHDNIRPRVMFADGTSISIQASEHGPGRVRHYCEPESDDGPWEEVELGFPSREIPSLMPYAETPSEPCETVYGFVPVRIVDALIAECGGFVGIAED